MQRTTLIAVIVAVLVAAGVAVFLFTRSSGSTTTLENQNTVNVVINENTNAAANANSDVAVNGDENVNEPPALGTEGEFEGTVFLKGYQTPSESFGILTPSGHEIGLESYDTRKEEFRPYIGDRIRVTFSKLCRSNRTDCCRSLFPYCGTVKSWEPVPAAQ